MEAKDKKIDSLKAIDALYAHLKKDRIVLSWQEFADRINRDRTYVSRVRNGHEPLTPEFLNAVQEAVDNGTFNVPHGTFPVKEDASDYIRDITVRLIRAEAYNEILEAAVAGLQSNGKDFSKKLSELREQVNSAINRRFDELRMKGQ